MEFQISGKDIALQETISGLMPQFEPMLVWILDKNHIVIASTITSKKRFPNLSFDYFKKHKAQWGLLNLKNPNVFFRTALSLNDENSGIFSASEIEISAKTFYLIKAVNPGLDLNHTQQKILESEYGIFSWHLHLESNVFFFSEEASFRFLGKKNKNIDYQEFYSSLSIESLQKFSLGMENAINYGKGFEMELLIENPIQNNWIKFICESSKDSNDSQWLTGIIKDLNQEKKAITEKSNLDAWLNSSNPTEVKNIDGETLAKWGTKGASRNVRIEDGKRTSTIYDFRNKPKYFIVSEPFERDSIKPVAETKVVPNTEETKVVKIALNHFKPDSKWNTEEKCLQITKHLGQILDAQVSALGIFDGSRFEWKAWWKSPNQYAMSTLEYGGEWLPELDWLVDVETENKKHPERFWWPQDMLPFQISKAFGEGWMLIAEPISQNQTSILAVKSTDEDLIKENTIDVIQCLDTLKSNSVPLKNENQIQKLQAQLAEKDLLIKEINHRAKNNLAIAASLVKMGAGYSESPEALKTLKETQKRLETLASLHELMYLNPESQELINIKTYLTQLVEGLVYSFKSANLQLKLHIDPVLIPMKIAGTIGLLVNELISNSFKHAFSPEKEGILTLDFHERGNLYKLRISDNGPGIKEENKNKESLGSTLIEEFIKQLKGNIEIDNTNGTSYFITFKK